MKRITAIILSMVLLLSVLTVTAAGAANGEHQAKNLKTLGLFQGVSDTDFALERQPTRTEALVMLIRAMGKETEAKSGSWKHPFTDVAEWANSYVGYAYEKGLTKGVSDKLFGANDTATCQMYLTFMLRALGYSDTNNQDFSWSDPYTLAKKAGILDNTIDQKGFLRADVAKVSWLALSAKLKGSEQTLAEKLIVDGVFTAETYKSVAQNKTGEESLSLSAVLKQLNEERERRAADAEAFDGFYEFVKDDPESVDLLTDAEIQSLLNQNPGKNELTYDEAAADVDLYFRAMRSAYAAYHYFGEAEFVAAEQEMMNWLNGKRVVGRVELIRKLRHSVDFVADAHGGVDGYYEARDNRQWNYYWCDLYFDADNVGYYTYVDGVKWYFGSFSDSRISMEKSLTVDGKIKYSPVFWSWEEPPYGAVVKLVSKAGGRNIVLDWTLSRTYTQPQDIVFIEQGGIGYIAVKDFVKGQAYLEDFVATGTKMRDKDVIIFDLRSNGGGNESYPNRWIFEYSGEMPQIRKALLRKQSKLAASNGYDYNLPATYQTDVSSIYKIIPNDTTIIVLTDENCASCGEHTVQLLRSFENSIVIGSNTEGLLLTGDPMNFTLPNSGIIFRIGSYMKFYDTLENLDYKGCAPDIWCEPTDALVAALALIENSGLADGKDTTALLDKIEDHKPGIITLQFLQFTIQPGGGFGDGSDGKWQHEMAVMMDGEVITDYSVAVADPSVCTVEKNREGKLVLTRVQKVGSADITITTGNKTATFRWMA